MKPPPFAYTRAESIGHAVDLLGEGAGDALILAGGQSLLPMLRLRLARPALIVDISRIAGLGSITASASHVDLGAMVTHREFSSWATANGQEMAAEAAGFIGHPAIRTMGTVVGSLAHADPSSEWGAVALALEAECTVEGPSGRRTVPALSLFSGPFATSLEHDEMITRVRFPLPAENTGAAFAEVAPRRGDPAVAGAAAVIQLNRSGEISSARIGLGGLGPTPLRSPSVEAALVGLSHDGDFATAAREVGSDIAPLADLHGSEPHRRRVAPAVVVRAVRWAAERAAALGGGRP